MKYYDPIWRAGGGTAGAPSSQALTQPLPSVTWPEGSLWPQSLLGAVLWTGESARELMPPRATLNQ